MFIAKKALAAAAVLAVASSEASAMQSRNLRSGRIVTSSGRVSKPAVKKEIDYSAPQLLSSKGSKKKVEHKKPAKKTTKRKAKEVEEEEVCDVVQAPKKAATKKPAAAKKAAKGKGPAAKKAKTSSAAAAVAAAAQEDEADFFGSGEDVDMYAILENSYKGDVDAAGKSGFETAVMFIHDKKLFNVTEFQKQSVQEQLTRCHCKIRIK